MPGIMDLLGGIGKLLGKIPIQGRKERWKNEIDSLVAERRELILGGWNEKKAVRVNRIDKRLAVLYGLLKNSASED